MTDDLLDGDAPSVPAGFRSLQWTRGFGRQVGPLYHRDDESGGYTRAFVVCEHHTNGMQNCHGGMLMTFADMALGHAVSVKRPDHYWVTVRLLTDFLSSARLGDWVEGTGDVVFEEEDVFTVQGRIWCADRTIMTGTGVFKAIGRRPPRPTVP